MTTLTATDLRGERAISDIGHENSLTLQIVNGVAQKMKYASLSIFTEQAKSYTTPVPVPLSPKRFHSYIDECTTELRPFSQTHHLDAAVSLVRSSFKYSDRIDPQDLSCRERSAQMDQWVKDAIETTNHEIELQRKTLFEPIPYNQQANSCFRYALERVGLSNFGSIDSPRALRNILFGSFFPVKDPQEGDLVLFSRGGQLSHLGICHQGKVLSKEGNLTKFAYIRPIEDLISDYGVTVQYFRKNIES